MPSKRQYDLVSEDGLDSQIPLHNDEAFQHGLHFQAKFIGSMDVPRPGNRVEIVAAMRRIRYEFKAKAIKKLKVNLTVCVEGIRVAICKKRKLRKNSPHDDSHLIVMHHPIYRIFYVSHDSQDMKIFSFIARDASTNIFKCNVFKAYKKNTAMRIVRTVGQAFEVCHKISQEMTVNGKDGKDGGSEKSCDSIAKPHIDEMGDDLGKMDHTKTSVTKMASSMETPEKVCNNVTHETNQLLMVPQKELHAPIVSSPAEEAAVRNTSDAPLTATHQMWLLRQQLEQQQQQTQLAASQVQLLKSQLTAETATRMDIESRSHQLLEQNRTLLQHINLLVAHIQKLEVKLASLKENTNHRNTVPQNTSLSHMHTLAIDRIRAHPPNTLSTQIVFESHEDDDETGTPDSGHQEMVPLNTPSPSELVTPRSLPHSKSQPEAGLMLLHSYESSDRKATTAVTHSETTRSLQDAASSAMHRDSELAWIRDDRQAKKRAVPVTLSCQQLYSDDSCKLWDPCHCVVSENWNSEVKELDELMIVECGRNDDITLPLTSKRPGTAGCDKDSGSRSDDSGVINLPSLDSMTSDEFLALNR